MTRSLEQQFATQQFANGYELVNGTAMHAEHGAQFQIPPPVLKRHVRSGFFVEIRVDSPRFSIHEEDAEHCRCPSCEGTLSKPVLSHSQPASLVSMPPQDVPSRGWGEDFWVLVTGREDRWLRATVDNSLVESRLHELNLGDSIILHEDHVLTIHNNHRTDMVLGMNADDLKELTIWLGTEAE